MTKEEAKKDIKDITDMVEEIVKSGYYTLEEVVVHIQDELTHLW